MMQKLRELYGKYGDIVRYLIIGALTTAIDLISFYVLHTLLGIHYSIAKVLCWILAVIFSFWGNKVVVFRTKSENARALLREAVSFVGTRLASLVVSLLLMALLVEVVGISENIANLICNIIVVIMNYVLGRLLVFKPEQK